MTYRLTTAILVLFISIASFAQDSWTQVTPSGDGVELINMKFYYQIHENNLFTIKAVNTDTIEWNCNAEVLLLDENSNQFTNSLGEIFVAPSEEVNEDEFDLSTIEDPEEKYFFASSGFHVWEPREKKPFSLKIELFNIRAINSNGDFLIIENGELVKM